MNKALPLDKLRGAVFGEPVAHEYHVVVSHIGISRQKLVLVNNVKTDDLVFFVCSKSGDLKA